MSAPLLWIVMPIAISVLFWFIQNKRLLVLIASVTFCMLLGLIAVYQPIGGILKLGPISLELNTTLAIFGRGFVLENSDRFFLAFINFAGAFWFLGSRVSDAPSKFIPIGMAIQALLTAALAVEPFLYSAVLIELVAIVSLPLLVTKNKPVGKGALRFLIYQSLALPFILLAGWILSGAQANPSEVGQLNLAAVLLGLGFAFWLAVFPFHIWMPELAEETHPYIAGFVLSILPVVFLLIMLNFLNGIVWLKEAPFLGPVLRTVGTVMVVGGGFWAATQTNLRRVFGFLIILESGFALLSISLQNEVGTKIFYMSFIPRMVPLGLMAMSLAMFNKAEIEPDLAHLKGQFHHHPIASAALLFALFSAAGLPLLAGFPIKVELIEQFAGNPVIAIFLVIGLAAVLFSAFRLFIILMGEPSDKWVSEEPIGMVLFLSIGLFMTLLFGILPNVFIGTTWTAISALLGLT